MCHGLPRLCGYSYKQKDSVSEVTRAACLGGEGIVLDLKDEKKCFENTVNKQKNILERVIMGTKTKTCKEDIRGQYWEELIVLLD